MRAIWATALALWRRNLLAMVAVAALIIILILAEDLAGWPFSLGGYVVGTSAIFLLHRALPREEPVGRAEGLRNWRALVRFFGLVVAFQLVLTMLGWAVMFVPIRSLDDLMATLLQLTPLGLLLVSFTIMALVGTALPAAADGSTRPLRLGWSLRRRSFRLVALGMIRGPLFAWCLIAAVFAILRSWRSSMSIGGGGPWVTLPLEFLYQTAALFAATLAVVVLCDAYRRGAGRSSGV